MYFCYHPRRENSPCWRAWLCVSLFVADGTAWRGQTVGRTAAPMAEVSKLVSMHPDSHLDDAEEAESKVLLYLNDTHEEH